MRASLSIALLLTTIIACRPQAPAQHASDTRAGTPPSSSPHPDTVAAPEDAPDHGDSLIAEDFGVDSIPADADSTWFHNHLGRPDSITVWHGTEIPATVETWHYSDLTVDFAAYPTPLSIIIRSPRYHTRRHIGVGSDAAAVRAAYGEPAIGGMPDGIWQYQDLLQELHYLSFDFRSGRVVAVRFGYVLD